MTWGVYKKSKELRGGGILDIFGKVLGVVSAPIREIGGAIGNAIKPGAGDDFKKGFDMVINPVQDAVGVASGLFGGGYPKQNPGTSIRNKRYIPRLDTSSEDETF